VLFFFNKINDSFEYIDTLEKYQDVFEQNEIEPFIDQIQSMFK